MLKQNIEYRLKKQQSSDKLLTMVDYIQKRTHIVNTHVLLWLIAMIAISIICFCVAWFF